MALKANALTTLVLAKDFLNVKDTNQDVAIEHAINRASQYIENYCSRPLKEATYTAIRLQGPRSPKLYLRAAPIKVANAVTVELNGTALTVWRTEADGDPDAFDAVVGTDDPHLPLGQNNHLWHYYGWHSTFHHPYNVKVTYTGGFATVPDDLQEAAHLVVQKLFRDQQRQFADVATVNLPNGSVTLFDALIPRRAKEILDNFYRVKERPNFG